MAAENKKRPSTRKMTRLQEETLLRQNLIDLIADGILSNLPVDAIIRQVINEIHKLFPKYRTGYTTINSRGFAHARYARQPVKYIDPAGKLPLNFNRFPKYLADLRAGEMIAAADIRLDPRFKPLMGAQRPVDFKATLVAPIRQADGELGALFLDAFRVHQWTSHEKTALKDASRYLMVAYKEAQSRAARQDEETRQYAHQIMEAALRTSGAALANQVELGAMLRSMLKNLPDLVAHDSADILLVDEDDRPSDLVSMLRHHNGQIDEKTHDYALQVLEFNNIRNVLETRKPLIIEDSRRHPDWVFVPERMDIRSALSAPLKAQNRLIGYISIYSSKVRFFNEEHVRRLQIFTDQCAPVLENAHLALQNQQRAKEAEALQAAGMEITSSLSQQEILKNILDHLGRIVPFEAAWLQNFRGDHFETVAAAGPRSNNAKMGRTFPTSSPFEQRFLTEKEAVILNDLNNPPPGFVPPINDETRHWMGVPIIFQDRVLGKIVCDRYTTRPFTEREAHLALALANQVAAALENARLYEEAKRSAQESETLREAARVVNASLDLHEIIDRVLAQLQRVVPSERSIVLLMQDGAMEVMAPRTHQIKPDAIGLRFPVDDNGPDAVIYRSGQPLIIADVAKEYPGKFDSALLGKTASWLGAPMILHGEVIGIVALIHNKTNYFTPDHARLASAFANHVAAAFENARLYEEARRTSAELENLQRAVEAVVSMPTLDAALERILEQLQLLTPHDSSAIFLQTETGWQLAGCRGFADPSVLLELHFDQEEAGLFNRINAERQGLILDDALAHPDFQIEPQHRARGWMGVPIIYKDRLLGIFTLDSEQVGFFNASHLHLAEAFASQTAVVIENARLYEQARRSAAELKFLHTASEIVASAATLEAAVERILEQLQHIVPFDSSTIFLREGHQWRVAGCRGFSEPEVVLKLHFDSQTDLPINQVYTSHQPIIFENAQDQPDFQTDPHQWIRGWMGVPVIFKERVLGVITLDSRQEGYFSKAHKQLVVAFAEQIAVAVENARLFEENRQRAVEAEALQAASAALVTELMEAAVLERIIEQVGQLVPFSSASVQLLKEDYLEIVAASGFSDPDAIIGIRFDLEDENTFTSVVARTRQRLVVADTRGHPIFSKTPHDRIKSWMGIPLVYRDEIIGVMTLDSELSGYFTDAHARRAQIFANQAAAALANARLFEDSRQRAAEAEALQAAGAAITASLSQGDILHNILGYLGRVIAFNSGSVQVIKGDHMEIVAVAGPQAENTMIGAVFPLDNPLEQRFLLEKQPITIDDTSTPLAGYAERKITPIRSWMGVPIVFQDRVLGKITINRYSPTPFTTDETRLALALANQAAAALANARLFTSLQEELAEHKRLEAAIVEARKLASLGTLAAGIAHELNSPLQTVTGASDSLMRRLADGEYPPELRANLERINRNAWRMAKIVRSLVEITRPAVQPSVATDLNALLQQALENMTYREEGQREAIQIVSQLDAQLPEVICQQAGILQVINSLLSNAVDAMLEGGVLTVRSSYQRAARQAIIEIEDSGGGISKEDRERIFDPFFTTKPVGEGTGLGLSLARSIVQAHGGQLSITSPPGSGTVFRFTLPQDGAMTGSAGRQNSGRYDE